MSEVHKSDICISLQCVLPVIAFRMIAKIVGSYGPDNKEKINKINKYGKRGGRVMALVLCTSP